MEGQSISSIQKAARHVAWTLALSPPKRCGVPVAIQYANTHALPRVRFDCAASNMYLLRSKNGTLGCPNLQTSC